MLRLHKADPTFTNFVPRDAEEAVDLFMRHQKNGLKPLMIPECLVKCAQNLTGTELDMFETWIINPNGQRFDNIVPDDTIRAQNQKVYEETLRLRDGPSEIPPLPVEDEKVPYDDDEKSTHSLGSFAAVERLQTGPLST